MPDAMAYAIRGPGILGLKRLYGIQEMLIDTRISISDLELSAAKQVYLILTFLVSY
jgi:hypothetical protein